VDPVPDPLLLRKSGSAGNRTRTSGSVARNSDHQTTEAVNIKMDLKEIGWSGMVWIHLDQDRYQWMALVITVMNF
jgi:hypothetical protein